MSITNIDNRNFYFDGSSNKFNIYNIDGSHKNNLIVESFEFVVNNINYFVKLSARVFRKKYLLT